MKYQAPLNIIKLFIDSGSNVNFLHIDGSDCLSLYFFYARKFDEKADVSEVVKLFIRAGFN